MRTRRRQSRLNLRGPDVVTILNSFQNERRPDQPDLGFSVHEDVFHRSVMRDVLEALDRAELTRTRAGLRTPTSTDVITQRNSEPIPARSSQPRTSASAATRVLARRLGEVASAAARR
jgi:hypothetical protein